MTFTVATTDLLPADVYALVRPEYRGRIIALKARRRVMIGPHISVVFESRETVLYQIQEVLWAERSSSPARISEEIAEYDRLIPRPRELTATLMVHGGPQDAGQALMESLLEGRTAVFLRLDGRRIAAEPLSLHGDAACPVQYLRFSLDREACLALTDRRRAEARLGAVYAGGVEVVPLPSATLDELTADLEAGRALGPPATPVPLPRANLL